MMIDRASESGGSAAYALMDSWFTHAPLIRQVTGSRNFFLTTTGDQRKQARQGRALLAYNATGRRRSAVFRPCVFLRFTCTFVRSALRPKRSLHMRPPYVRSLAHRIQRAIAVFGDLHTFDAARIASNAHSSRARRFPCVWLYVQPSARSAIRSSACASSRQLPSASDQCSRQKRSSASASSSSKS